MKRALLIFLGAAALGLAGAPALAQDDNPNIEIINGQLNLGNVWANLNVTASNVQSDVNATAAAISNSFSGDLADHAEVENFQQTRADIIAELTASLSDVGGEVTLTSAAVGNTASVHSHGGVPCPFKPDECPNLRAELILQNRQSVLSAGIFASLDVTTNGVGTLNGTSAAIGNSLSVEAVGPSNVVDTYQVIDGPTGASVVAQISGATGVNLTSAAVANTVSIDTFGN